MKSVTRAGLWLAALGLALAPSARSAVMTGNAQVSSGTAPYNVSYTLAQDMSSMTISLWLGMIPSSSQPNMSSISCSLA